LYIKEKNSELTATFFAYRVNAILLNQKPKGILEAINNSELQNCFPPLIFPASRATSTILKLTSDKNAPFPTIPAQTTHKYRRTLRKYKNLNPNKKHNSNNRKTRISCLPMKNETNQPKFWIFKK